MNRQSLGINDTWSAYRYGDQIKIVYHKRGRLSGGRASAFKREATPTPSDDERLSQSLSRTRSTVFELAACNDFEYFVTLTLDSTKRDRGDLASFRKALAQFIRDQNKRRSDEDRIAYLFVPEQHRDGCWHMHGLIRGLRLHLDLSTNEHGYLDWRAYRDRFGFISLQAIRNKHACCSYVAKYVTKAMQSDNGLETDIKSHGHLYFASQGLKRREPLERFSAGALPTNFEWDYENDYVKIRWLNLDEFSAS